MVLTQCRIVTFVFLTVFVGAIFYRCTKDVGKLPAHSEPHNYPDDVAQIILTKCAVSGCHNSQSKNAAGGLNLATWKSMLEGGNGEAVVIPYRPDHSVLMFYTNSFDKYGTIRLSPQMPLNNPSLSEAEVKVLYDWILQGAPDAAGEIPFENSAGATEFYVASQGCDVVTVFDAQTMLATRVVDVGELRSIEGPHTIKVAPDNMHWYVAMLSGGFFLKYKTSDNLLAGKVNLGFGNWHHFTISSDSKTAYVTDRSADGKIAVVDLINMTAKTIAGLNNPHGTALSRDGKFLYVTSQGGNHLYKMTLPELSQSEKIFLDADTSASAALLGAHAIAFTPKGDKYLVTCQQSNEVRIFKTSNDSLVAIIPVGIFPQEIVVSRSQPYGFVSVPEEPGNTAKERGLIAVINFESHTLVKTLFAGFQPQGMALDETRQRLYVSNRNQLTEGPPPHHAGLCDGRNGFVTAIDLRTLELLPGFNSEVSIDPYALDISIH